MAKAFNPNAKFAMVRAFVEESVIISYTQGGQAYNAQKQPVDAFGKVLKVTEQAPAPAEPTVPAEKKATKQPPRPTKTAKAKSAAQKQQIRRELEAKVIGAQPGAKEALDAKKENAAAKAAEANAE